MFKDIKTYQRKDYRATRDLSRVVIQAGLALAVLENNDNSIPVQAAILTGLRQNLAPQEKEK